jgi:hypothetical protein
MINFCGSQSNNAQAPLQRTGCHVCHPVWKISEPAVALVLLEVDFSPALSVFTNFSWFLLMVVTGSWEMRYKFVDIISVC